jgi:hypothetical protein
VDRKILTFTSWHVGANLPVLLGYGMNTRAGGNVCRQVLQKQPTGTPHNVEPCVVCRMRRVEKLRS